MRKAFKKKQTHFVKTETKRKYNCLGFLETKY